LTEKIRKQYFRTAIKLAFAKRQSKKSDGYFHQHYLMEVENNRNMIHTLLASTNENL
jgi:hypothetical protein